MYLKLTDQINKQNMNFPISKSVKSLASRKENVRFPDSPDFEKKMDFQTKRDVQ